MIWTCSDDKMIDIDESSLLTAPNLVNGASTLASTTGGDIIQKKTPSAKKFANVGDSVSPLLSFISVSHKMKKMKKKRTYEKTIKQSKKEKLHIAQRKMNSMSLYQYYAELHRTYPNRVFVAAPLSYSNVKMEQNAMNHRLQDQCISRVVVYTDEWLTKYSNQLHRLPALVFDDNNNKNGQWMIDDDDDDDGNGQSSIDTTINPPTKIWGFLS